MFIWGDGAPGLSGNGGGAAWCRFITDLKLSSEIFLAVEVTDFNCFFLPFTAVRALFSFLFGLFFAQALPAKQGFSFNVTPLTCCSRNPWQLGG